MIAAIQGIQLNQQLMNKIQDEKNLQGMKVLHMH